MDEQELRAKVKQYHFNSIIQLTETVSTPGTAFPNEVISMRAVEATDMKGKRVLDIGCRDGKFSFAAEKRGASEVIGIDNDLSPAMVEFLIPFFESKLQAREMNLMDLTPETFGRFDVVMFFGVLYHLRYPFQALKVIRNVLNPGGKLLIETALLRDDNHHALLYCPVGKESPYEDTSCTFFNEKGMCDTLTSMGFRIDGVEHIEGSNPTLKDRVRGTLRRVRRILRPPMLVKRSTVRCTFTGDIDPDVARYWDGIHNLETPSKRQEPWVPAARRGGGSGT